MPVNLVQRFAQRNRRQSPQKDTDLSGSHIRVNSQMDSDDKSREESSEQIRTAPKAVRSPYKNKLQPMQKPADPSVESTRSEKKFESYLEQQLLNKNNKKDAQSDLQEKYDKVNQELQEANRYIQNQLKIKDDQEKLILSLRSQLSKVLEQPSYNSLNGPKGKGGRASSPKGSGVSQMQKILEENAKLRMDLDSQKEVEQQQNQLILQLQNDKRVCEDRITTLQGEIESFWQSQQQRLSSKSNNSGDSPIKSTPGRNRGSPENEVKNLQRLLNEQNEKLEITFEVNNILKMQLNKLMQTVKEFEALKLNNQAEAEIKQLKQQLVQAEKKEQQTLSEYEGREKLLVEQIRQLQNQSINSRESAKNPDDLNMERARKKIELQKQQKDELKSLLKETQDQLQDTIIQNQEYRKLILKLNPKMAKEIQQKEREASFRNTNSKTPQRQRVKTNHGQTLKDQKIIVKSGELNTSDLGVTQKKPSGKKDYGHKNTDSSHLDSKQSFDADDNPPILIEEAVETKDAKNLVATMMKAVYNFKKKVHHITKQEQPPVVETQVASKQEEDSSELKGLSQVLLKFGLDPNQESLQNLTLMEENETPRLNHQAESAPPPVIENPYKAELSPEKQNVNLMRMLIELQTMIKDMDPHDFAQYQKTKNSQSDNNSQFLEHFNKAYNGLGCLNVMIPEMSTTFNSTPSLADLQTQTVLQQKQNQIDSLQGDLDQLSELLKRKDNPTVQKQINQILSK